MDRVARSQYYQQNLSGLTPLQRHQQLVSQALQQLPPGSQQGVLGGTGLHATETDFDALRKHHRFLRGPEDDAQEGGGSSWGARLARRYYSRLFKEYAIADLSRCKESKIGLRWRTQAEVVAGKGQFTCGAKGCDSSEQLCAYEVNFAYSEAGQQKQALVKLCLCEDCACRLNYRRDKGRQYRRLGGSTAFDQAQQQQLQEEGREREAEEERHRQRRRRDGQDVRQRRQEQQEQDSMWQQWDSAAAAQGSHRTAAAVDDEQPRQYRQRERSLERRPQRERSPDRRPQQRGSESSDRRAAAEGEAAAHRKGSSSRGVALDSSRERTPRGASAGRGGDASPSKRARREPAAAAAVPAAAVDPSPRAAGGAGGGGGGAGRAQQDRWQMDGDGDADGAEVAAETHADSGGGDGGGGVGVSDRWELHEDGDLNDADIERWLDSLFTAVGA